MLFGLPITPAIPIYSYTFNLKGLFAGQERRMHRARAIGCIVPEIAEMKVERPFEAEFLIWVSGVNPCVNYEFHCDGCDCYALESGLSCILMDCYVNLGIVINSCIKSIAINHWVNFNS